MAFIPDRLVVLYSTHRPKFPWEKIGGGKTFNSTPAGIYDLRVYIYIEDNLLNTHHIRWCGCRIWVKIANPYPVPEDPFTVHIYRSQEYQERRFRIVLSRLSIAYINSD